MNKPKLLALAGTLFATLGITALLGCQASAPTSTDSAQAPEGQAKVKVVASFYPMADFAQKIGGDHVEVTNLCPAGTEPHEWEPSPTDITSIEESQVFVYNGADMEGWVKDALESVDTQKTQVVEASDGIQLRAADHSHDADGDEEAEEGTHDPHVWLNPENAKAEAKNIMDALVAADPDNKADYEANYEKYAQEFDELDAEFSQKLSQTKGKTIVVSHEAFGYLCDRYGLTQMPITGMDAEGEPDAQAMAQVIDFVRQNDVKVIFSEDLVSPKVAEQIANETGASCEVLNPIEGLTDDQLAQGEDYFSVMRSNLDELVSALNQE